MWIFTVHGFYSVVENREDSTQLLVRARQREHLIALKETFQLPGGIVETPKGDYRFRVFVDKERFTKLMIELVKDINYDNFKDAAASRSIDKNGKVDRYVKFLGNVWKTMFDFQETLYPRHKRHYD